MTFTTITASTPLDAARAALDRVDHLVVVDNDGRPVALLTSVPDVPLADVDWPPLVTLPATTSLKSFVGTSAVTLLDLDVDLPGLVVVDNDDYDAVVDVIPIERVEQFLAGGGHRPESTMMGPVGPTGDASLAGDPRLPVARVRCAATDCGYVNALRFFDASRPPKCANPDRVPHTLVIRRAKSKSG
jgi:hypothetical protein